VETANHAEHAYFDSALMLLFFLLVGRAHDHAMRRKTRAVAGNLAALRAIPRIASWAVSWLAFRSLC
jgi:Cu2+-exporting ATPase